MSHSKVIPEQRKRKGVQLPLRWFSILLHSPLPRCNCVSTLVSLLASQGQLQGKSIESRLIVNQGCIMKI